MFRIIALLATLALTAPALAGTATTTNVPNSGTTAVNGFTCNTTSFCTATVLQDNLGVEKGTAANPLTTTGGGVAQGSTTSGQNGPMAQGAVTSAAPSYSNAQTSPLSLDQSGNLRSLSNCAASTSAPTYSNGTPNPLSCDLAGNLRATGTFSATIAGFAPGGTYASLSAATSSTNVSLPAGTVVAVYNTGTLNYAYVNLGTSSGVSATTSNIPIAPGGASCFTVGANTFLAGITSTSTTTLTIVGGSGLCSSVIGGAGGGSGGGGSNGFVAQNSSTTGQTGPLVQCAGLSANPTYTSGNTNAVSCDTAGNVYVVEKNSGAILTAVQAPIATQASTVPIGQVGIAGSSNEVCVSPTITASAYSAGNEVGGLITFTSLLRTVKTGVLQSVRLTSKSVQSAEFDVTFFSSQPTGSTWTDKSAPAIVAADIPFVQPTIKLTNNSSVLGTHTIYGADGIGRIIEQASTSGYAIITTPGTPTFASTSDLQLCVDVIQD